MNAYSLLKRGPKPNYSPGKLRGKPILAIAELDIEDSPDERGVPEYCVTVMEKNRPIAETRQDVVQA